MRHPTRDRLWALSEPQRRSVQGSPSHLFPRFRGGCSGRLSIGPQPVTSRDSEAAALAAHPALLPTVRPDRAPGATFDAHWSTVRALRSTTQGSRMNLGKDRSPAAVLGLSPITLGIYYPVWCDEINAEIEWHEPDIRVSPRLAASRQQLGSGRCN